MLFKLGVLSLMISTCISPRYEYSSIGMLSEDCKDEICRQDEEFVDNILEIDDIVREIR